MSNKILPYHTITVYLDYLINAASQYCWNYVGDLHGIYCPYFWSQYKKTTFSKIRVAYDNVYRKRLGVCLCLMTFLILKLFSESQFIHLPLDCHLLLIS